MNRWTELPYGLGRESYTIDLPKDIDLPEDIDLPKDTVARREYVEPS